MVEVKLFVLMRDIKQEEETDIQVAVKLDNIGTANIDTGIGFFDHMLTALSVHSGISMDIAVKGDLYVDGHHTVEDTGIVLGKALSEALGDKSGITRSHGRSSGILQSGHQQPSVFGISGDIHQCHDRTV